METINFNQVQRAIEARLGGMVKGAEFRLLNGGLLISHITEMVIVAIPSVIGCFNLYEADEPFGKKSVIVNNAANWAELKPLLVEAFGYC